MLKCDACNVHLWSGGFQYILTAKGLVSVLDLTIDFIRYSGGLGGMAERDQPMYRHGQERVQRGDTLWMV